MTHSVVRQPLIGNISAQTAVANAAEVAAAIADALHIAHADVTVAAGPQAPSTVIVTVDDGAGIQPNAIRAAASYQAPAQ